jgi:SAM-dependent methyltransferase
MMPRSTIIDAYDAIAPLYEEYSGKRQAYLDSVDELVIANLSPEFRLLDIGSGDGRRLAKIRECVGLSEIIAVEPSAEMAKICEHNVGIPVYQEFGENIDQLDIGRFDVATALWNIFGHIPSSRARLQTLINIRDKLKPGGKLILDINNRHNALAYGFWTILQRLLVDTVNFKESRGDARYQWEIDGTTFDANGHLFTAREIEKLFADAGFKVSNRYSVNYDNGAISESKYRGQLFYILTNDH